MQHLLRGNPVVAGLVQEAVRCTDSRRIPPWYHCNGHSHGLSNQLRNLHQSGAAPLVTQWGIAEFLLRPLCTVKPDTRFQARIQLNMGYTKPFAPVLYQFKDKHLLA